MYKASILKRFKKADLDYEELYNNLLKDFVKINKDYCELFIKYLEK